MSDNIENKLSNIEQQVEKLATLTMQGFEDAREERLDIKKDIKNLEHKLEGTNNRIDDLANTRAKTDIVESHENRISALEETLT